MEDRQIIVDGGRKLAHTDIGDPAGPCVFFLPRRTHEPLASRRHGKPVCGSGASGGVTRSTVLTGDHHHSPWRTAVIRLS
jgi:hypothetical protein